MRVRRSRLLALCVAVASLLLTATATAVADEVSPSDDFAVDTPASPTAGVAPTFSSSAADPIVLYRQDTAPAATLQGNVGTAWYADDFAIPDGASWQVAAVGVVMLRGAPLTATTPPTTWADVDVAFYADNTTTPGRPGALLSHQTVPASSVVPGVPRPASGVQWRGPVVLPLPTPVTVGAGVHWIALRASGVPSNEVVGFTFTGTQVGAHVYRSNWYNPATGPYYPSTYAGTEGLLFGLYTRYPLLGAPQQPVDVYPVTNVVKAGATVPVKFTARWADDLSYAADLLLLEHGYFKASPCTGGQTDQIEWTATGGTAVRWDTTDNTFVFNWRTPKSPGTCGTLMLQFVTGQQLWAEFQLK